MNNTTYYQRDREIILSRGKDYYENDKERLREQAGYKYRNLSEEDKNKLFVITITNSFLIMI